MPLDCGIVGVAEVRGEAVMAGQPDVFGGGDHHVGDHPALEAGHPVGQHPGRDTADRGQRLGDQRQRRRRLLIGGEARRTATGRTPAPRRTGTTPVRLGPSRSPDTHPVTTPPGGDRGDARCATTLSPRRPGGGSCVPTPRSRRRGRSAASAWPTSDPATSRPVRRPARPPHRSCGPARPAAVRLSPASNFSTTRLTVLWVVPHSSAAAR